MANRVGVPFVNVELVCSDLNEHRRRVESRASDIPGHHLPTWSEVVERDYRPWDGDRLIIDTARLDLPQSLHAILSAVAALMHVEAGQAEDISR